MTSALSLSPTYLIVVVQIFNALSRSAGSKLRIRVGGLVQIMSIGVRPTSGTLVGQLDEAGVTDARWLRADVQN